MHLREHLATVAAISVLFVFGLWLTGVEATFDLTYSVNTVLQFNPLTGRNFTPYQYQVVSFPFSDTNNQDNDIEIGTLHWAVTVPPTLITATVQLVNFAPSDGDIFGFNVDVVDSTVRFSGNQQLQNSSVFDQTTFSSRRLLALEMRQQFERMGNTRMGHERKLLQTTCAGCLDGLQHDFQHNLATSAVCFATSLFCDSGPDWQSALIDQVRALEGWQKNVTKQLSLITDQIQDYDIKVQQYDSMITNLGQLYQGQAKQITTLNNGLGALAAKQDADNVATQKAFTTVYDAMVHGNALVAASTDQQLKDFAQFVQNQTQALITTINLMQNNFTLTRRQLMARSRDNARLIKKLGGQMMEIQIQKYVQRAMNKGIFQATGTAKSMGFTPYLDPNFPGQAPATSIPSDVAIVSLTQGPQCVSFVNNTNGNGVSGGQLWAHQVCYEYLCQVGQILEAPPLDPNWEDFVEYLGPTGCSYNSTSRSNTTAEARQNCQCWVQVTHKSCKPAFLVNGNTFTFTTIAANSSNTAFTLTSAMCDPPNVPQADTWDGRVIDNFPDFATMLGGVCKSNVLDDNYPGLAYFTVTNPGATVYAPSIPSSPVCNMQMDYIFTTPIGSSSNGNTLPFTVFRLFTLGWKVLKNSNQAYESFIYGFLPNGLTCQVNHFQRLPDNRTYTRHSCYFAAVSPTTIPVFSVVAVSQVTNIQATAYDRAPRCTGSGCVFGNVVQQQFTQTTSGVNLPNSNLLPQVGDVIFGIQSATGQTTLIDVPRSLNVLTNVPSAQAGSPLYLSQGVPANYNLTTANSYPATTLLDVWETTRPFGYNALDAGMFVSFVTVGLSNGRPVLTDGDAPEWMFGQRQAFSVSPLTDMKHQGKYVLQANTFGGTGTIQTNVGPVVQSVFEGCAQLSTIAYTDGTVDYTVSNPWQFPIQSVLRIRQVNTQICPNVGDITYALTAGQNIVKTVEPCGNQSFQIFEKSPGLPLVSCGPAIYINSQVPLVNQVNRAVWLGINTTVIDDQVQIGALDVIGQANGLINAVLPVLASSALGPAGLFKPNQTISQAIDAYNRQLIEQGKKPIFSNITAVQIIKPYVDLVNNITAANNAIFANFSRTLNESLIVTARLLAREAQIVANMKLVNASSIALSKANAALIAALQRSVSGGMDDCPSCTSLPVLHQICCILNNIGTWIGIVIMVIVFVILGYLAYRVAMCIVDAEAKRKTQSQISAMENAAALQAARAETAPLLANKAPAPSAPPAPAPAPVQQPPRIQYVQQPMPPTAVQPQMAQPQPQPSFQYTLAPQPVAQPMAVQQQQLQPQMIMVQAPIAATAPMAAPATTTVSGRSQFAHRMSQARRDGSAGDDESTTDDEDY